MPQKTAYTRPMIEAQLESDHWSVVNRWLALGIHATSGRQYGIHGDERGRFLKGVR